MNLSRSAQKNSLRVKPKTVVLLTLASLSVLSQAAINPNGPFADTPLHLQSKSETQSSAGVKPNVVLQIDDSGSMAGWVSSAGKNRMEVTKKALLNLVQNPEYKNAVNWNMITLCNTDGSLTNKPKVYSNNNSWRFGLDVDTDILPAINSLYAHCGTPSTGRYMDSVYLLRAALDTPGTYRCQKSYVVIFSDGEPYDYLYQMQGNETAGFLPPQQVLLNYSGSMVPNPAFASQTHASQSEPYRFKMVPDANRPGGAGLSNYRAAKLQFVHPSGLWNSTLRNWYDHNLISNFLADSVFYNDLKTSGVDAAGKRWNGEDDDPSLPADHPNRKQVISTFAIGFGLNSAYLANASTANNYQAFNANDAASLNNAFSKIFDQINAENKSEPPSSFSSISPTLSGDDVDIKVPALAAAVRLDVKSGSSEVRFYDVVRSGKQTKVLDTYKTPLFASRRVIVNTGENQNQWLDSFSGSQANNAFFGIPHNGQNNNEWKNAMIPWIMRNKADNHSDLTSASNALKYRVRSTSNPNARDMGDVIAAPIHSYGPQKNGRQQFFITAANDGLVYLFESSASKTNPYELKVNYMPAMMERESATDTMAKHFADIVSPDYVVKPEVAPHRYMVNGGMVIRTTEKNPRFPQRHFLAGNMGQGGRGTYALNLGGKDTKQQPVGLDATNWLSSVPLFETQKGVNNVMGYTIGAPQIGRLAQNRTLAADFKMNVDLTDVRYATFIGSGTRKADKVTHQSGGEVIDNTEAALYIYHALGGENVGVPVKSGAQPVNSMKAGELMSKIPVPNAGNNRGGLMQPTLVDMDFDGAIDIAYAADYRGGLYRFDFRKGYTVSGGGSGLHTGTSGVSVKKIFQAQNKQIVTSAPAIYRRADNKYVVIFGTGSDLYQSDLENKDVQSVYGIYDDLTIENPAEVQLSQLLKQDMGGSVTQGTVQTRTLSNKPFEESTHKGWYFDLPAGERVVVKPDLLLKTVIFTTRSYSASKSGSGSSGLPTGSVDPCIASSSTLQSKGESWLMQVKSDTGGNLTKDDVAEYAYIDYLNQNTGAATKYRPDVMYAGYKSIGGGILTYVLSLGGNNADAIGNVGNAYTTSGDAGGTGTDPALTPGGKKVRQCLSGSNHSIFLSDSGASTGVNDPLSIYGKACGGASLTRLSWREIF
ncbi:MAG: PilC/PilY family type IV pilus protein [Alysiella sp.]|uniref:PilC/PilY family type IV pilus protein n=1 Tax=Alysiella sp. TaxID=1872483 RepID=UPI0026DD0E2B|nr:PilC/PilY family type IV pilus protein [Alysiella sp.]MDO4433550.1 PilC/PilY family type IV pilus protein [Alysiella sp.]